jgi:YidC/Oxa1 family membrane protein insertase
LAEYRAQSVSLQELTYYGWPIFAAVARPMQAILHVFYHWVGNYGLAIIMLTILVRGCMFPVSRRQALNAQKMQELQPEVKRIQEKYKNDAAKKAKEQQELFRQHNYNPLSGCLPALVQLPIFLGLYRSLMVDVELRQAPLFGDSIRWASNLAAPDMFWNWSGVMPDFVTHGTGLLGLGPYLNILPLVTIALFIWQQKMFMPPPADEQAALQQKMMQYMSIFVGIMFFKVASGLCVYLIASSIWGICERKLLPRTRAAGQSSAAKSGGAVAASVTASGNGATVSKKRQRGRR